MREATPASPPSRIESHRRQRRDDLRCSAEYITQPPQIVRYVQVEKCDTLNPHNLDAVCIGHIHVIPVPVAAHRRHEHRINLRHDNLRKTPAVARLFRK
jgi:hypothetical protein